MYVTLVPAYGRDYKSAAAVRADWKAGKDFVICCYAHPDDGRFINRPQAKGRSFTIRFKSLRNIVIVKG